MQEASARSEPGVWKNGCDTYAMCWNTLLSAWAVRGDARKVEEVLQLMVNCGFEPDTMMLGTAVQACGKAADAETAKRIFTMITARGVSLPNRLAPGTSK